MLSFRFAAAAAVVVVEMRKKKGARISCVRLCGLWMQWMDAGARVFIHKGWCWTVRPSVELGADLL
jgi:hypothetical protein